MLKKLADTKSLKGVLDGLRPYGWEHVDLWQQGEFHHDVLRTKQRAPELHGDVFVVITNCNGGVKEVLCLHAVPKRWGLWHYRQVQSQRPDNRNRSNSGAGYGRDPHACSVGKQTTAPNGSRRLCESLPLGSVA